jgi:L-alanine-DL-glutamate epimerase-like enolase superfamily enzyme
MTYDSVKDLALRIEGCDLERRSQDVSSEFTRVTTVVRLRGGGEHGVGEDVTYDASLHDAFPSLDLAGEWTLDSFSQRLDDLDLFADGPSLPQYVDYRRWAFESAALDLALRQARQPLYAALGRAPRALRFVASMRIDSLDTLQRWTDLYPTLRFKLDPVSSWTEELIRAVAALGRVDVTDLKGAYEGTPVDQAPDPILYARVAEAFPNAWIEDPNLSDAECARVLEPHRARISWDAPIHSVEDIEALPFPPGAVNIKPSRFGSVRRLLAAYDYCAERSIPVYGGGQFELGPGRGQIQYLASLFSPDASNDVAPGGYNTQPGPGLPESPLEPAAQELGFRWGEGLSRAA